MFCLFCQLTFPVRDISFHSTSFPVLFQLLDHMLYFVSTFLRFYFEPGYIISFYFCCHCHHSLLSVHLLSVIMCTFCDVDTEVDPQPGTGGKKTSTGKSSEAALISYWNKWFGCATPEGEPQLRDPSPWDGQTFSRCHMYGEHQHEHQ